MDTVFPPRERGWSRVCRRPAYTFPFQLLHQRCHRVPGRGLGALALQLAGAGLDRIASLQGGDRVAAIRVLVLALFLCLIARHELQPAGIR